MAQGSSKKKKPNEETFVNQIRGYFGADPVRPTTTTVDTGYLGSRLKKKKAGR